eukprot:3528610-Pyramimonas_sp.AAC.1
MRASHPPHGASLLWWVGRGAGFVPRVSATFAGQRLHVRKHQLKPCVCCLSRVIAEMVDEEPSGHCGPHEPYGTSWPDGSCEPSQPYGPNQPMSPMGS